MRISDWSSDVCSSDLVRLDQADFTSVSNSTTSPTANKINLIDSGNARLTYFYVPKVANPGTTASNYDKYRIGASNSLTSYNGGAVQVQSGDVSLGLGKITIGRAMCRVGGGQLVQNTVGAGSIKKKKKQS